MRRLLLPPPQRAAFAAPPQDFPIKPSLDCSDVQEADPNASTLTLTLGAPQAQPSGASEMGVVSPPPLLPLSPPPRVSRSHRAKPASTRFGAVFRSAQATLRACSSSWLASQLWRWSWPRHGGGTRIAGPPSCRRACAVAWWLCDAWAVGLRCHALMPWHRGGRRAGTAHPACTAPLSPAREGDVWLLSTQPSPAVS